MSKTTWILLGLALIFYLAGWMPGASALMVFGVVFELLMYISMFADAKSKKDQ